MKQPKLIRYSHYNCMTGKYESCSKLVFSIEVKALADNVIIKTEISEIGMFCVIYYYRGSIPISRLEVLIYG